jgi:ABC-type bacteriocin/lantibiotic exporter with double-glycine peptidase domain
VVIVVVVVGGVDVVIIIIVVVVAAAAAARSCRQWKRRGDNRSVSTDQVYGVVTVKCAVSEQRRLIRSSRIAPRERNTGRSLQAGQAVPPS